jgi:hypothetical protein
MNLKLHFDEERKNHKEVSTRNPTVRTAHGLDIGEIMVKSIMAEYRHHEPTLSGEKQGGFLITQPGASQTRMVPAAQW